MADVILRVKVLQGFKDTETGEPRTPGVVLDMTPDRYVEAVARLARWDGKFLEVIGAVGEDVQAPEVTQNTYMGALPFETVKAAADQIAQGAVDAMAAAPPPGSPTPEPEETNPRIAILQDVANRLGIDKTATQMKTGELEAVAKELGIDLTACKTNPERAAVLNAWVESYVKE